MDLRTAVVSVILSLTLLLSACAGNPGRKIEAEQLSVDFAEADINRVLILPGSDIRDEAAFIAGFPSEYTDLLAEALEDKNYRVMFPADSDHQQLNNIVSYKPTVTRERLNSADVAWIRKFGPDYARWILLPVLDSTKRTPDYNKKIEVSLRAYLFGTVAGEVIWEGRSKAADIETGADSAAATTMSATRAATQSLLASLPVKPSLRDGVRAFGKVRSVGIAPFTFEYSWQVNGADSAVTKYVNNTLSEDKQFTLEYSHYNSGYIGQPVNVPKKLWQSIEPAFPNLDVAVQLGEYLGVEGLVLWATHFEDIDAYVVNVKDRVILHRRGRTTDNLANFRGTKVLAPILNDVMNDFAIARVRHSIDG